MRVLASTTEPAVGCRHFCNNPSTLGTCPTCDTHWPSWLGTRTAWRTRPAGTNSFCDSVFYAQRLRQHQSDNPCWNQDSAAKSHAANLSCPTRMDLDLEEIREESHRWHQRVPEPFTIGSRALFNFIPVDQCSVFHNRPRKGHFRSTLKLLPNS